MPPRRLALLTMLASASALLSGCQFDLANVKRAQVEWNSLGATSRVVELDQMRMEPMVNWFRNNKTGWSSSYATYAPGVLIRIEHNDGSQSVVNPLEGVVVVNGTSGQVTHAINAAERNQLLRVLKGDA